MPDEMAEIREDHLKSKSEVGWVVSRLTPWRWRIASGLVCIFLAALCPIVDPLLMRSLLDSAIFRHDIHLSIKLVLGIGLCYLLHSIFFELGSLVNFSVSQSCVRNLKVAILDRLHSLSVEYHEQTPTGEKVTRIERDVDEISGFGADAANQSVMALVLFVLNIAMMAKLSFRLTLIILPLVLTFMLIQQYFRRRLKFRADESRAKVGSASNFINEHLAAVPQIQFLAASQQSRQKAVSVWDAVLKAKWTEKRTQTAFAMSIGGMVSIGILAVLIVGITKVLNSSLTVGGLVAFYTYVTRIFAPIDWIMAIYARLQSAGASLRRVRSLLETIPTLRDVGTKELNVESLSQGIRFENVKFAYDGNLVLEEITFDVGAGERLAILGVSGSGKSTLARLMVRALDPQIGNILLEGRPLREYRLDSLRRTVCYVPQQPVLFHGTIRENLQYGNLCATDEEMRSAIKAAQLELLLTNLPHGMETSLGPGGIMLSGGERQRLAIARALLKKAAVLILDEATSALDALTEQSLLTSLANYRDKQTLVIISHRTSSLTWLDRFLVLQSGRIIATGRHENLYKHSESYRRLASATSTPVAQV
jgi:ABC-type bacteriocin/lantibiotic exporter with double-glycine peptidase domain